MPSTSLPRGFLRSTRIVTLAGETPVERLAAGMQVLALSGEGAPLRPVRQVRPGAGAGAVRIAAGAIEDGVPIRDLRVRPGHGIGLEDSFGRRGVVPAALLVNGATITREAADEGHVEVLLEAHALLMADGVPAESSPAEAGGLPGLAGAELAGLRTRLLERALACGWALTPDDGLTLEAEAGTVEALPRDAGGDERPVFLLPPGCARVRLRSRRFVPADADPATRDERTLGVALERVVHDGVELAPDGPAFGAGFLPVEGAPGRQWRWTVGEADLLLPPGEGATVLELFLARGWSRYWRAPGG